MQKSLRRSRALKAILTLVYIIGAAAAGGGTFTYLNLSEKGYYSATVDELTHDLVNDLCDDDMYTLNGKYLSLLDEGYFDADISETLRNQLYNGFMDDYTEDRSNFFFTISDMDDKPLIASYREDYQCARVQVFQTTTYEKQVFDLTDTEYGMLEYPDEFVDMYVGEYWLPNEQKDEEAPEVETEASLEALLDGQPMEFDEDGAFVRGKNEYGSYIIRLDHDGTPTSIQYDSIEDTARVSKSGIHMNHVVFRVPHNVNSYYISGYVRQDLTAHDHYASLYSVVVTRYRLRYVFPVAAACGAAAVLFSVIGLLLSAGYSSKREKPGATVFEKIPFDLFTALLGTAMIAPLLATDRFDFGISSTYEELVVVTVMSVYWLLILLWWCVSIAMRIRTGTIVRNNLLIIAVRLLLKGVRKLMRSLRVFTRTVPFIWQAILGAVIYYVPQVFFLWIIGNRASGWRLAGILMLLVWGAGFLLLGMILYNMSVIERGGETLAGGELTEKIPAQRLFGRFRTHAQHLNSLGDNMNKAVNDRIKSEMFRTELIANVSHDIRTPLTSIINYTDLLSKLELDDPQAKEYVDVLSRQSARLRKLTEDVLEASKATTGNIKVQKQILDLRVLIEQIEGEFSERLEKRQLTLVKDLPDTPQYISVDGRLMWRVMDNLFGNICKYAMEGTRVYLNVVHVGDEVICMLRNISATQLNISAEALLERFVQGDRSRNTEGSGLGLSIAQSLTSLQDGRLELGIDGDLFKVTLTFPAAELPEEA